MCNASVVFQIKERKFKVAKYAELSRFTSLFCWGRLQNVQIFAMYEHSHFLLFFGSVLVVVAVVFRLTSLISSDRAIVSWTSLVILYPSYRKHTIFLSRKINMKKWKERIVNLCLLWTLTLDSYLVLFALFNVFSVYNAKRPSYEFSATMFRRICR